MTKKIRVYVFGCKISKNDQGMIAAEIERGRAYYNAMIAAYNPHPRQRPGDIRKRFPASTTECYKGTYDLVASDFDRAVSAKRPGKWPGDPYHFRRATDNSGASVGVRINPPCTWASLRDGKRNICQIVKVGGEYAHNRFGLKIKVDKEHDPIELSVALPKPCRQVRRTIPDDALISHVRIQRAGDFATGVKYHVHVTTELPEKATCTVPDSHKAGIDFGWYEQPNGSLLVGVTSEGECIQIPAYAVRMWRASESIRSERDAAADAIRPSVPAIDGQSVPKSAAGLCAYIQRNQISGFAKFEIEEFDLHCREDHVRRRYQNIRDDIYRKAAARLGPICFIEKLNLKPVIEKKEEGPLPCPEGERRFIASLFVLQQLLRNNGAVEVKLPEPIIENSDCERLENAEKTDRIPTIENASTIRELGISGALLERAPRKAVRKYRKKLANSDRGSNAMATA
jgi:hypothetical protein